MVFAAHGHQYAPVVAASLNVAQHSPSHGAASTSNQATTSPHEIASSMSLPLSAAWAMQNRAALASSLRATLELRPSEELVITKISAAAPRKGRKLQAGVKVDFVVGVSDRDRAVTASNALNALAVGSPAVVTQFVVSLDQQLAALGKPTVSLAASDLIFEAPQALTTVGSSASWSAGEQQQSSAIFRGSSVENEEAAKSSGSGSVPILLALLCVVGLLIVGALFAYRNKLQGQEVGKNNWEQGASSHYNAKVAAQ